MGSAKKRERRTKTRNFITPEYLYHNMSFRNFETYVCPLYRGRAWHVQPENMNREATCLLYRKRQCNLVYDVKNGQGTRRGRRGQGEGD